MTNPIEKTVNEARKWADAVFAAVRENQSANPDVSSDLAGVLVALGTWNRKATVINAKGATMDTDTRAAIDALDAACGDFEQAAFLGRVKALSAPYKHLQQAAKRLETFKLCANAPRNDNLIDVTAAAARLDRDPATIRRWCKNKRKPCQNAEQIGGKWAIPEADIPK